METCTALHYRLTSGHTTTQPAAVQAIVRGRCGVLRAFAAGLPLWQVGADRSELVEAARLLAGIWMGG